MDQRDAEDFVSQWATAWSTPMHATDLAALYTDDAATAGSIRPAVAFTQASFDAADGTWTGETVVEKWYLAEDERIVVHWVFEGTYGDSSYTYPGLAVLSMREGKCFLEEHYGSDLALPRELQLRAAASRGASG